MENVNDKIAKKAYELYLKRGGHHGYHMQDWIQAEKEILSGGDKKPAKPAPKKK
jgi:hypothetical protein